MTTALIAYGIGFLFGIVVWTIAYWCGRIDARHVSYLDGYEHGLIEAEERRRDGA